MKKVKTVGSVGRAYSYFERGGLGGGERPVGAEVMDRVNAVQGLLREGRMMVDGWYQ